MQLPVLEQLQRVPQGLQGKQRLAAAHCHKTALVLKASVEPQLWTDLDCIAAAVRPWLVSTRQPRRAHTAQRRMQLVDTVGLEQAVQGRKPQTVSTTSNAPKRLCCRHHSQHLPGPPTAPSPTRCHPHALIMPVSATADRHAFRQTLLPSSSKHTYNKTT